MTETQLVNALLSARDAKAYKKLDAYLTKYPRSITDRVRDALEAYEMYRQVLPKKVA